MAWLDFSMMIQYKFMDIKSWLNNFGVDVVKNRCDRSGHRNVKFAVSKEEINGINWFWNVKDDVNNYWVGVGKSGCDLLCLI